MAVVSSFLNVINPQTPVAWDSGTTYKANVLTSAIATGLNIVLCPCVSNSGHLYFATGYNNSTGAPLNPTVGSVPGSDAAWFELI
jgi:hypothetical protein